MSQKIVLQKYKDLLDTIENLGSTPCTGKGVLFDTDESIPIEMRLTTEPIAKDLCKTCPIMYQCLDYALAAHEPYGIWGGTTPAEREKIKPVTNRN